LPPSSHVKELREKYGWEWGERGGRLKDHKNPVKMIKWFIQPIVEK
jgi:hypothetical protein